MVKEVVASNNPFTLYKLIIFNKNDINSKEKKLS